MQTYDSIQTYLALVAGAGLGVAATLVAALVMLRAERVTAAWRGAEALRAWRRDAAGVAAVAYGLGLALALFGIGV